MRWSYVVEWCLPNPSILRPFGLLIVESSPITYPVTRGCVGRPRRLGCCWRCCSRSASTSGCISTRKCFSHLATTASCDHGASEKNRLSPLRREDWPTSCSNPLSVRLPSHSISPSSTVTKYCYCGLEDSERKTSPKLYTSSSRHIIRRRLGHP